MYWLASSVFVAILAWIFGPASLEYVCAALLGASSALVFTLGLALPALLAGPTNVARLSGATLSISYSTAFIGPFIGGGLWDLFGLPALAFVPVVAASAMLVIAGLMLPARHWHNHLNQHRRKSFPLSSTQIFCEMPYKTSFDATAVDSLCIRCIMEAV